MRRILLGAGGITLCALALLWAPPGRPAAETPLQALGLSMGPLRVGVEDALFLRAERLRREGRVEGVPALYETILELDPRNTAALDHLVAVYAYDLGGDASSDAERFAWWLRARDVLLRGLERHPDDATLHMRAADLYLDLPASSEDLAARVRREVGEPGPRGVAHLVAAARIRGTLPRRGRAHLLRLALLLPVAVLAAPAEQAATLLVAGHEILVLRRPVLAQVLAPVGPEGAVVTLEAILADGLEAAKAARSQDAGALQEAARRYRARYPHAPLAEALPASGDDG